jgi:hypothetical protein
MTKININGEGHQVEIDHDGADLSYIVEKAQKLWDETRPRRRIGPGFGVDEHKLNGQPVGNA